MFNNSGLVLDLRAFYRYIANHKTTAIHGGKEKMMNRIRLLAIGSVLALALANAGQQTAMAGSSAKGDMPAVEAQLKALTQALDLTGDQQAGIKPVLEKLHDATTRLVSDSSLSREERLERIAPSRYEADRKIRAVLNEKQKTRLDQFEQEPHPEMHEGLN